MHPEFEQATLTSWEYLTFRVKVRLAESRGWVLASVSVADGVPTASLYRPCGSK
jgi:hypothetical protein